MVLYEDPQFPIVLHRVECALELPDLIWCQSTVLLADTLTRLRKCLVVVHVDVHVL